MKSKKAKTNKLGIRVQSKDYGPKPARQTIENAMQETTHLRAESDNKYSNKYYGEMPEVTPLKNESGRKPENVRDIENEINNLFDKVMRNPQQAINDNLIDRVDVNNVSVAPALSVQDLHINPQDRILMEACILRVLGSHHSYIYEIYDVIGDLRVRIIGKKF